MAITLPPLPFDTGALAPYMSAATLDTHHGKHHAAYVAKTSELIAGSALDAADLPAIVRSAWQSGDKTLFQQAAQAWNHEFFWQSLNPGGSTPSGRLRAMIDDSLGGIERFAESFKTAATSHFASGWAWLCLADDRLTVLTTHDADTPLVQAGVTPLLTLDLWEHAYYLDYQNRRADFVAAFLGHLANWDFAEQNLHRARRPVTA